MTIPPRYPRIARLAAGHDTRDDVVLDRGEAAALLCGPVVVEEKLDGANVVVWTDASRVECALRAGPGAMDRAGQLGPLRAWLAQHDEAIRRLLADRGALYAEWLLLTHTVAYDRLPAYLVALDLWVPETGFVPVDERDLACVDAGLATPPEVWRGIPGHLGAIESLMGSSVWGQEPMEGLVVRGVGRPRRLAKLLRADFNRLDDVEWRHGRPRNRLSDQEASWH